jgi:hypothetical protein
MIPLLAPLLGSLAGSLLPATLGSGIAGALGLKGAAGAFVASAAPKAIGAGIGTLLAGGDLGDAALNAVGFGAAGALLGGAGSTGAPATSPRPTMRPDTLVSSMPAPSLLFRQQQPKPHRQRHCPIWRAPPSRSQKLLVAASSLSRRVRCRLTGRAGRVPWTTRFWPPLFQTGPTLDWTFCPPPRQSFRRGRRRRGYWQLFPWEISRSCLTTAMLAGMSPEPERHDTIEYLRSRNMVGFA